jgi:tRNA dimethylallyltransferase
MKWNGNAPLIVIVGPTASGKSSVALQIAERVGGEIICADARTIYRGMDIGTAKPSRQERARIPHHVVDVVEPDMPFNAVQFKRMALAAIDDIVGRGKMPILVGGTGLYIDSVLFDFQFRGPGETALRAELNSLNVEELQARLREEGISLPGNQRNPRHLIRALETKGMPAKRAELRGDTIVLGILRDRQEIVERINQRVEAMVADGLEAEVASLAERYAWDAPGMLTIGYREWCEYFAGRRLRKETIELIQVSTRQYAKRQQTWFKRNNSIQWFSDPGNIVESATTFLNKTA